MIVLYIIAGIIVLFLVVAALVGRGWNYEKNILIQAPRTNVWGHVNSLGAMTTWSPWLEKDPAVSQTISGVDGTPGATYSWDSQVKKVGAGRQTIVSVNTPAEMTMRIEFIRPFKSLAEAYVRLEEERGATRAIWGIESSMPYPMNIMKIFGFMQKAMNKDFMHGLNKLKAMCEK
ncbi:MAG TPA: SRPBCC family protein [Puia sp.]|nr:SRPBCC family protein [Puia sp.]